jgi:hypothetical protein
MKKSTKLFIILLIVGAVGLAVMLGAIIGAGVLYSRETSQIYKFDGNPAAVSMDLSQAQVEMVASDKCRVEAYVKAWRIGEIDMDDVLVVRLEDDVLEIEEKGFPSDFLGLFPQPYEVKITLYAPQSALDAMEGDLP